MDASAAPGGDGSAAHPFRTLAAAPRRGRLRLASGVYPGGLLLEDVEIVGGRAVVVAARAGGPCIRTRGTVRLQGLQIQGGTAGLVVESGRTTADGLSLSGQRGAAIEVQSSAELRVTGSVLQASVSGFPGLRVLPGAKVELRKVRLRGPFQRGVDASDPGALRLSGVEVVDAVTGVWLSGGAATLESVQVSGGRGPGLYVAGGALKLRDVRVTGHEYGLLSGGEATVDVEGLHSAGADRAGVGLVRTRGVLEKVHVESAGSLAALQLVSSEVRIHGLEIAGGRSSGLFTRDSRLTLEDATFVGPRAADPVDGDAVQIRGGSASLAGLRIQDCSGIAILAAEHAMVTLARSSIRGAGVAGLSVETEARLTATDVLVEGTQGPAVLVDERGTAELHGFTARGNRDGVVWAECSKGAQVDLDGWTADVALAPAACIRDRGRLTLPR